VTAGQSCKRCSSTRRCSLKGPTSATCNSSKEANFDGATFHQGAEFVGAKFGPVATFVRAAFESGANFDRASFVAISFGCGSSGGTVIIGRG